jgi:ABC-type nitrate/sulfonate/bicarbonate transport system permease component
MRAIPSLTLSPILLTWANKGYVSTPVVVISLAATAAGQGILTHNLQNLG